MDYALSPRQDIVQETLNCFFPMSTTDDIMEPGVEGEQLPQIANEHSQAKEMSFPNRMTGRIVLLKLS